MTRQTGGPPQRSGLTGDEADARRRTRGGLPEEYLTGRDGDRGGGGDGAVVEALMHSALRGGIRRGGLQNSGLLAAAALRGALYRRRWTPPAPDRPGLAPKAVQAGVPLVRQGDAGEVARRLDLGRDEVQRVQRTAGHAEVSAVLHDDAAAWRVERQAHRTLKDAGPEPGTPLSGLWRSAADDAALLERAAPREAALIWFSASLSHDPASSAVESAAIDRIAERHPALWYSIERGIAQDPGFDGDLLSGRADKATALAGAVWNADGRPLETMEEYFAKALPWFRDKRADLNLLRDTAEAVAAAEADGLLPAGSSRAVIDEARRSVPGFSEALDRARERPEARAGGAQDDRRAALSAFDELRGMPQQERAEAAAPRAAGAADARTLNTTRMVQQDHRPVREAVDAARRPAQDTRDRQAAQGARGQRAAQDTRERRSAGRPSGRRAAAAPRPGERSAARGGTGRTRQADSHRSRLESPRGLGAAARTGASRRAAAERLTRQTRVRNRTAQIHKRRRAAAAV
ncbi:hypothetical protein [Nocardiopsis potens]|uniref:hypothetical protein n=1 Tax=Nocardiopsis potens TaxID=1246458 RepID=UPI000344D29C|nr:hypothetical protein [Nocardiopsis potens]